MTIRCSSLKGEWKVSTSEIIHIIIGNKIIQEHRHESGIQSDRRVGAESLIANTKCSLQRLVVKGTLVKNDIIERQ
jgi:hypothetical protein